MVRLSEQKFIILSEYYDSLFVQNWISNSKYKNHDSRSRDRWELIFFGSRQSDSKYARSTLWDQQRMVKWIS